MRINAAVIAGVCGFWVAAAQAQAPMSAIDWLSESSDSPFVATVPALPKEEAVTGSAAIGTITVTPLDEVRIDAVGLVPAKIAGLPPAFWGATPSEELARLLGSISTRQMPALQDLLFSMLLAELDPPTDSDPSGALFLARIDKLLALGAVEQAKALLERAGPNDPARFQRWFDASLLTGTEDAACQQLRNRPSLLQSLPARIFCLARGGDWNAAALTLQTGRALGQMTGREDALLTRFLDPEIFEGAPPLPVQSRPSPLAYRLYEAIGEALPTTTLPVAFAQADLRSNTGWKAQLEAAERLARSGALADNQMLGLYTERAPAASGGIWDRVAAIQRFDIALAAGATDVIATSLPKAWQALQSVDLEHIFAGLYASKLPIDALDGSARALAFRVALLAPTYATTAQSFEPRTRAEKFLKALALGEIETAEPHNETARAISDGFRTAQPSYATQTLINRGNLGEVVLIAMADLHEGAAGDINKFARALTALRAAGFEGTARAVALQALILGERR